MTTVKISSKNQIVFPKEAREQLGVGPGDELLVVPRGRAVIVLPKPDNILDALRGSAKGIYGDIERYLRTERASWNRKRSAGA